MMASVNCTKHLDLEDTLIDTFERSNHSSVHPSLCYGISWSIWHCTGPLGLFQHVHFVVFILVAHENVWSIALLC